MNRIQYRHEAPYAARYAKARTLVRLDSDVALIGAVIAVYLAHVSLPNAYVIEDHLIDGTVEGLPWDFARHFADADYRARSEAAAARDHRLFGKRLRALRTDRGLTQQELAERSGISRVTISRFEAGEQLPRYQTMVALGDGLGLPIERLIAETPD